MYTNKCRHMFTCCPDGCSSWCEGSLNVAIEYTSELYIISIYVQHTHNVQVCTRAEDGTKTLLMRNLKIHAHVHVRIYV